MAPTLTATPARLREGDTITVTGTACPTPLTVQALAMQILPADFAKGLPPFAPIDASGVGLVQTAGGVTFHVVATEGRTSRFFRVDCSDGSSTMTTVAAMVYPPIGQIWWIHNAYTTFVAGITGWPPRTVALLRRPASCSSSRHGRSTARSVAAPPAPSLHPGAAS